MAPTYACRWNKYYFHCIQKIFKAVMAVLSLALSFDIGRYRGHSEEYMSKISKQHVYRQIYINEDKHLPK